MPRIRRKHTRSMWLIARIDHAHTHGWQVKLSRPPLYVSKMFSDGVHGGKRKALCAAKIYRDRLVKKHRCEDDIRYVHTRDKRSKTGVVGVRRVERLRYSYYEDKVYGPFLMISYMAYAGSGNNVIRKQFSVRRHGEEGAFRLASRARKALASKWRSRYL